MATVENELLKKFSALPKPMQIAVEYYIDFLYYKHQEEQAEQNNSEAIKEKYRQAGVLYRINTEIESPSELDTINTEKKRSGFGILKGKVWMAEDFDEPLEELKEYM